MLSSLRNVVARRDLLLVLVRTELRLSTAERKLGWLWWMLDPLLMMLIYWALVVGVLGRGQAQYKPYWVFIFFGLVTWKQIGQCLTQATEVLRRQRALIRSAPFPTIVLPLASLASSMLLFCFGFAVLLAMAILAPSDQHAGNWWPVVQVPLLLALQVGVLVGPALGLACYGLFYRDLSGLVPHAVRAGFYISPSLFGHELVRELLAGRLSSAAAELAYRVYMLNPAALLLSGYRSSVFYGEWISPGSWAVLLIEAVLSVCIGILVYQHHDRRVIKFI